MSFEQRVQAVEMAAQSKEAARQQRRTEMAAQRQEKWNSFIGKAKDKVKQFRDWDRQAGAEIRKVVDMAPGVVGALSLTAQEKAVETRNAAYEATNRTVEAVKATGQAAGEALVEGAMAVGGAVVGAGVLAAEGAKAVIKKTIRGVEVGLDRVEVSIETAIDTVEDKIDEGVELAEEFVDRLDRKGREIRDEAEAMRQGAVESIREAIERTRGRINHQREVISGSLTRTRNEITGRVDRTLTRGKERLIKFHQDDMDRKHTMMIGALSLKARAAGGVRAFFENWVDVAGKVEVDAKKSMDKRARLKSTYIEVSEIFVQQ